MYAQDVLTEDEYTFADLSYELSRDLNARLPDRTLRYWIAEIGIDRNELGLYEFQDLQILRLWIKLKPRLRTIERFKTYLRIYV